MPNYENIPDELRALHQWVCATDTSKLPMEAQVCAPASTTDPETWADFATAFKSAVTDGNYPYLGFVFADSGIVGIDIDIGYDEDGLLSLTAADIIGHCQSYTEKSKSGRGFHIFVRGKLPFKGKNNLAGVEIYKDARYFIVTGETLLYTEITENQAAIDYVVQTYFPESAKPAVQKENTPKLYRPVWALPGGGRLPLRPRYPPIAKGGRHIALVSLAGTLHNVGYTKEEIYKELCAANLAACRPPLDETELRQISTSIARYER